MQTKKLIKIVVSCCVLVGIPIATAQTQIFSDVDSSAWYSSYVRAIAEKGIVDGYSDGSYRPVNAVNRAELAKILFNTIDILEKQNKALEARIESLETLNGISVVTLSPASSGSNISLTSSTKIATVSEKDSTEIKIQTNELESNIIESVRRVEILSEDILGIRKIEGKAKNTGNQILEDISVKIEYYDFAGEIIQTDTTEISPAILEPNETGTFTFIVPDIDHHSYQIQTIQ